MPAQTGEGPTTEASQPAVNYIEPFIDDAWVSDFAGLLEEAVSIITVLGIKPFRTHRLPTTWLRRGHKASAWIATISTRTFRCRLPFVDRAALDPEAQAMFDGHQKGGATPFAVSGAPAASSCRAPSWRSMAAR